jgi:putative nucleotidyltransferase with HDIG domain
MDERAIAFIEQFKRRGALMIFVPAIIAALLVATCVGGLLIRSYGRLTAAGLNALASESLVAGGLDTPEGIAVLRTDIEGMLNHDAFHHISVMDTTGRVVATAGPETWTGHRLEASIKAAMAGRTVSSVTRPQNRFLVHVVTPLTAGPDGEPYGVAHADWPFALVMWDFAGAMLGFIGAVVSGAAIAHLMLFSMVRRAERALRRQELQLGVLNKRLGGSLADIERQTLGTLQALTAAVDARDSYTAEHSLNVADYAVSIGRQLELDEKQILLLEQAALLHDIGKIGVHESALMKPGRLTAEEYTEIKQHPAIGADIIERIPFLEHVVDVVLCHHERWDGSGYPRGLRAEDVPLPARILAVADAYDAMTSNRPYRMGLPLSKARRELLIGAGTQFDPKIVSEFLAALDSKSIRRPLAAAAESA